jgi:hypothetical protein
MDIIRIGEATDKAVRVLENNDKEIYATLSNMHFLMTKMIAVASTRDTGYGAALSSNLTFSNVVLKPLPQ